MGFWKYGKRHYILARLLLCRTIPVIGIVFFATFFCQNERFNVLLLIFPGIWKHNGKGRLGQGRDRLED